VRRVLRGEQQVAHQAQPQRLADVLVREEVAARERAEVEALHQRVDVRLDRGIDEPVGHVLAAVHDAREPQPPRAEHVHPVRGPRREGIRLGIHELVAGRDEIGDDEQPAGREVRRDVVEEPFLVGDEPGHLDAEDEVVRSRERHRARVAALQAHACVEPQARDAAVAHLDLARGDREALQAQVRMRHRQAAEIRSVAAAVVEHVSHAREVHAGEERLLQLALRRAEERARRGFLVALEQRAHPREAGHRRRQEAEAQVALVVAARGARVLLARDDGELVVEVVDHGRAGGERRGFHGRRRGKRGGPRSGTGNQYCWRSNGYVGAASLRRALSACTAFQVDRGPGAVERARRGGEARVVRGAALERRHEAQPGMRRGAHRRERRLRADLEERVAARAPRGSPAPRGNAPARARARASTRRRAAAAACR
jgi:hypothetical protein